MRQYRGQSKTYFTSVNLSIQSLFPSVEKQKNRLAERKLANNYSVGFKDLKLRVDRGVYRTGVDTTLMVDILENVKKESFLEIGCGTGAISLYLARNFKFGLAVDVNELAVINASYNCVINMVNNLEVRISDVFSNVEGSYDVVICNPPYNMHEAEDEIEKMFWDTKNNMKTTFFKNVAKYLKPSGRIYFGWADFADLDFHLPIRMAKQNGLELTHTYFQNSKCGANRFIVFQFEQKK